MHLHIQKLHTIFSHPKLLIVRSAFIESMRSFLNAYHIIEVHSPILSTQLIPERHIEVYTVEDQGKDYYLTPSPEIHLKRMLALLSKDRAEDLMLKQKLNGIYEITHSFRKMEQKSPFHLKEFLMLEYYCLEKGTQYMQDLTINMLYQCVQCIVEKGKLLQILSEQQIDHILHLVEHVEIFSLEQAFAEYTSFDYTAFIHTKSIAESMVSVGLDPSRDAIMDWEDIFHYALVQYLEPALPKDAMVFLYDYPSRVQTLAKTKPETLVPLAFSDRWELYIAGIEVANCFNEENDPDIILNFMHEQTSLAGIRKTKADWDKNYLRSNTLPQCSGIAMGIDRVFMALLGNSSLQESTPLYEE